VETSLPSLPTVRAGLSFEAALREYLESFRLPGESQKIYRILESWSRQFHRQCPGIFRTSDAVLVLAFSLVLLNTDRHKSTVSPPPPPPPIQTTPTTRPLCRCKVVSPTVEPR